MDITNLKTIHKLLFVKKFKDYIYKSKFITSNQKNIDINLKNWDLLSTNIKYKFTEVTKNFNNLDSVYTYWIDQINEKFSCLRL